MIPVLETRRLVLRGFCPDDFEPYARFMADPEVSRYLTGEPLSRNDAWRSLAMMAGHWLLRGYGMWAVERKADRTFIGRVGLWNPEGWPSLEVGWTLGRPYWGQGYATEAASTAMEYGFLTQNVSRLISVIDPRNRASQSVAARLGEIKGPRHEVVHGGKTFPTDIWSIGREDWEGRRTLR